MNKQRCPQEGDERWRINLNELRTRTGMSYCQIAAKENLSEKSVIRVFSGEAKSPGVDLVRRIIHALGGCWNEIFAESGAVIGSQDLATLKEAADATACQLEALRADYALRVAERDLALAEIAQLKSDIANERQKNDLLTLKLQHKEEIIALHNYYNKLKPTETN